MLYEVITHDKFKIRVTHNLSICIPVFNVDIVDLTHKLIAQAKDRITSYNVCYTKLLRMAKLAL